MSTETPEPDAVPEAATGVAAAAAEMAKETEAVMVEDTVAADSLVEALAAVSVATDSEEEGSAAAVEGSAEESAEAVKATLAERRLRPE